MKNSSKKIEAGDDFVQEHVDTLKDIIDIDYDVEIEVEEVDIIATITYANGTMNEEITEAVVESLEDYCIEEEYADRALAKPLLASNFNAYDFKRQMCDFFETGYHVDSFDLVKLFAEKLKVDYLL